MGIFRGFKDTKAMMRIPRVQLNGEVVRSQIALQLSTGSTTMTAPERTRTTLHAAPTTHPRAPGFMPRPTRTGGGEAPSEEAMAPIVGVTLEEYARVVRGIAAYNYDQSMLAGMAADHGIAADRWPHAHSGWNRRIQTDPAVARRFSDIYHEMP